jgi:glycosyltransferase involved in cell wall biosynthesis
MKARKSPGTRIEMTLQAITPVLSLIVPCHNHANEDRRAMLDALFARLPDRDDLEVLLVDDHSSVAYTPPEFVRLRLRQLALPAGQTHAGAARNSGMAAASGQWLGFIDSDDLVNTAGLLELLDGLAKGTWQDQDLIVLRAWSFLNDDPQRAGTRHPFVNRWIARAANGNPMAIVRVPSC